MAQQYVDFSFVKEHADFAVVLTHYDLQSTGTGDQRRVRCPFHRDRRPSCQVNVERKIFHCFSCEAKGNILEFVARIDGNPDDLRAAAIKISAICGIETAPPKPAARHGERQGTQHAEAPAKASRARRGSAGKSARRAVHEAPAEPAEEPAAEGPVNPPLTFALKLEPEHPYLAERGISPETITEFGLGYCARGMMAGRICIPVHDAAGNLVAYAGRYASDEVPEDVERYKLPPKFQKSRVLFNLHRLPPGMNIVLVEGYWSVFRLHALGVPVVGLMGWSVSAEQLALLRERGVRFVTVLMDGDDAGRKAREKVLPALADAFFVRAPVLPDGEKPDTLPEGQLRELVAHP